MRVKIFSYLNVDRVQSEVNNFLSNSKIEVIGFLQSESFIPEEGWCLTISIFYKEG